MAFPKRRLFPALPALILAAAAIFPAAAVGNPRPNLIVILADDLGCPDIRLYDGWVETPHIERMAREGMRFTDFHSNSSVCSPTRAALLTGRYQQRYGIVDVRIEEEGRDGGLPESTITLPEALRQNGYATALFGKWHLGYHDRDNPVDHGFDEFIGFLGGGADYHKHTGWRNGLKREAPVGYSTDIITAKSVDFIHRHKDKPFFLFISHQAVHNPNQTREDAPQGRAGDWKQNQISDINRPRYKQLVLNLDASVGTILATLRQTGLAESTLVFFFSDNGDVRMSPVERSYRGGKFSQYESGHRVPAVAWWPGRIQADTKSDELLAGFDLFPTFIDIAGISEGAPENLDGKSAKVVLLENKSSPAAGRDLFFGYEPKLGTALRRGNWKLIVKDGDLQLYNLAKDPKEETNVAAGNEETVKSMRDAIEGFKMTVVPGS
jgi:arylsulfatase A-like enzyme